MPETEIPLILRGIFIRVLKTTAVQRLFIRAKQCKNFQCYSALLRIYLQLCVIII